MVSNDTTFEEYVVIRTSVADQDNWQHNKAVDDVAVVEWIIVASEFNAENVVESFRMEVNSWKDPLLGAKNFHLSFVEDRKIRNSFLWSLRHFNAIIYHYLSSHYAGLSQNHKD